MTPYVALQRFGSLEDIQFLPADHRFHVFSFSPSSLPSVGRERRGGISRSRVSPFRLFGAEGPTDFPELVSGKLGSRRSLNCKSVGGHLSQNSAGERANAFPAASKFPNITLVHGSDTSHGRAICFARRIKQSAFVPGKRA